MSRHSLAPRPDGDAGYDIVVGYERQLGSFFGFVYDRAPGAECPIVVSLGGWVRPIVDPREVLDAVRPYAIIPPEMAECLSLDRIRESDRTGVTVVVTVRR